MSRPKRSDSDAGHGGSKSTRKAAFEHEAEEKIMNWLSIVEERTIVLYVVTLIGAAASYMFASHKGFAGAIQFLKNMFPGHEPVFYDRLDFFIVTFLGSIVGFILFGPDDKPHALMAGLGWVSAYNIATHKAGR